MGTLLKQVKLQRPTENGRMEQVLWLNKIDKLKVGHRVTLEGEPNVWWTIAEVGKKTRDSSTLYSRHGRPILRSIDIPRP